MERLCNGRTSIRGTIIGRHLNQEQRDGAKEAQTPTVSSSSSRFCIRVAIGTGFGSATTVVDEGGFAKWIFHFCTVTAAVPAVPDRGRALSSYCTDRPSLIPGLELRDRMRGAPGEPREGLPDRSTWSGRNAGGGGGGGDDDDDDASSCASRKGATRARGGAAGYWAWVRVSMSVVEVCEDNAWEVCAGSLLEASRITRPNVSCMTVTSVLGSETAVCVGEAIAVVVMALCWAMAEACGSCACGERTVLVGLRETGWLFCASVLAPFSSNYGKGGARKISIRYESQA